MVIKRGFTRAERMKVAHFLRVQAHTMRERASNNRSQGMQDGREEVIRTMNKFAAQAETKAMLFERAANYLVDFIARP